MSSGTTGRSFTTESAPLPWMRRARTTTPALLRARSGVSKKVTSRICASSGSMPSAMNRRAGALRGIVSFSSTVFEPLRSSSQLGELFGVESGLGRLGGHRLSPFGRCAAWRPWSLARSCAAKPL